MRPIANIIFADYEDRISVMIHNKGLGPLIIEKFYVLKDEKIISDNLVDCMPDPPEKLMWTDLLRDFSDKALIASEKITALELSGNDNDVVFCAFRDGVRESLAPLKVRVVYKDIYGKRMPTCERQLDGFGRHFL